MKLNIKKRERIVGTFVIAITICFIVSFITVVKGKNWFKDTVEYSAIFQESYNLKEGAPVKLFNADVGKVYSILPFKNNVKVTIAIFEEQADRIREDTLLTIESPTFIGEEFVAIKPGSEDSKILPPKSLIKSVPKKTIMDVMEEFEVEKTAKKIKDSIKTVTDIVNALNDPNNNFWKFTNSIHKTADNIEKIVHSINMAEGSLGQLIKKDEIQKEILESITTLKKTLKNIEKGSYNIPEITTSTEKGIAEIRRGVENIDRATKSLHKNFFIKKNLPDKEPLVIKNIEAEVR